MLVTAWWWTARGPTPTHSKHIATEWDVRVRGLRIVHEGMYHLDLPFCPVDASHAMVYPAAFDAASRVELERIVPEPIVLTDEERSRSARTRSSWAARSSCRRARCGCSGS